MRTAADIGVVGGVIALATVKYLLYKGSLSPEEVKVILADAQKRLTELPDGAEAARLVGEIYERVVKDEEQFY